MNRRRMLAATATLATPFITGCVGRSLEEVQMTTEGGGTGGGDEDGTQQTGGEETVEIADEEFNPGTVQLNVEGTVHWKNTTDTSHQIQSTAYTGDAHDWSFSEEVPSGESVSKTFDEAGVYQYYDLAAGQYVMCGLILVGGATTDWEGPCLGSS